MLLELLIDSFECIARYAPDGLLISMTIHDEAT